jgi:hypothetical protein
MGKTEKRIHRWLEDPPPDAPINHVEAVLNRYFAGCYEKKSGSHIVVRDWRLGGFEGFGLRGEFTIAVKNGQRVRRCTSGC